MKTPEGRIKEYVKKHLRKIGAYFFMPVQVGYGETSLDFLCCVDGKFVAGLYFYKSLNGEDA